MRDAFAKLKKLRGRSATELRVRGAQFLQASAERAGLSAQSRLVSDREFVRLLDDAQRAMSPDELLSHFRTRSTPACFAAFAEPEDTRAELRHRFGARASETVLPVARQVQEGKFDLLGRRALEFGLPVDWHREPTSGLRAPLAHWTKIDFLDARIAGDKKFIWELNRHQYFMLLGRAYWHTGDESYAATFAAHIASWMDANPPKRGINWASNLEVALRAISWLWSLHFFRDSPALTPTLFLRLLKFLYAHARHIETYLSTYFSPNTHLTGEALGLYYLGTLLPELKDAARWRATGERILYSELDRHVLSDGVYFEHSTYYHRYTTDFYTHLLLLTKANGTYPGDQVLEEKLIALLDHLLYVTRPDGTTPLIGDDDGGRLAPLDDSVPDDFRATLAVGAALFAREDYKYVAGEAPESVLWLIGPCGLRAYDALPARVPEAESRAFAESGYYVLRDGWGPAANYMLIDGGPHGASAINYGHAHADALAFDMAACGRTMLVDPGTYTYTGSTELRDHFRSSQAHNTLTIDAESSSVPAGAFRWRHVAPAHTHTWFTKARFDYFAAVQDGYNRLAHPARHERAVLFIKNNYWIMRDRVKTKGPHRYEMSFQFTSDADPRREKDCLREARPDAPGLELYAFAPGAAWRSEEGWVSRVYGKRERAPVYRLSLESAADQEFITVLIPLRAGARPAQRVVNVEAEGGLAFSFAADSVESRGSDRELLLVKSPSAKLTDHVVAAQFSSDFEWTWARFSRNGDELEELILLEGQCLYLQGSELLRAPRRIRYLWGRHKSGRWQIEADGDCEIRMNHTEAYVRN